MFTQPCYIKKNTQKLRDELRKFGLKCNHGKAWGKYLCTFYLSGSNNEMVFVASPEYDLENNPSKEESINCGENEDLFLAIAALRDDTDKYQWFKVFDEEGFNHFSFCNYKKADAQYGSDYVFHKATVEELIKHFDVKK